MFAVGYYNGKYPGYRKVKAAEWTNPEFHAALVQAHQAGDGWPLLEEDLVCKNPLCVAKGWAMLDDHYIVQLGYYPNTVKSNPKILRKALGDTYNVFNLGDELSWTEKLDEQLSLGENWTVKKLTKENWADIKMQTMVKRTMDNKGNMMQNNVELYPPCLFVKNAALPGDGSRRSRINLSKRNKSLKRIKSLKRTIKR